MALIEVDRARAAAMRFGPVLADAGYGINATFRAGLSERGLRWVVGIPRIARAHPTNGVLQFPPARSRCERSEPDQTSRSAEKILADAVWRKVTWRRGTKGRLTTHFAAARIRVADGAVQQTRAKPAQHLPGEEAWVVGGRRTFGEMRCYLSNLPADTSLKTLAATIKACWACAQAHQGLKEKLGLDRFAGRSPTGLHRHALMTMLAFAFLQHSRLATAKRGKRPAGPPPQPNLPTVRAAIIGRLPRARSSITTMPAPRQRRQHAA
jgi:SRSO17 transposase